jgi:hypothetical protein
MPLGKGLLNVVARSGVSPPSSDVVMLVTERFTGELYGPRQKQTADGRSAIP